jgi:2-hydroxycyclohexanecarboxyl-CoA dehydrogenase
MCGRLAGKGALVLGAGNRDNMAQVIARRFVAEGASVVVAGRKMDELERFATEIGGEAMACDITDRGQVFALAAGARQTLGQLDIAVNSTGWGLLKPVLDHTVEDVERMTALQFEGPFYFCQAMVSEMNTDQGGRGGSIIQISSATATIMLNDHAAYMGTKAGTDHVVRCVANEFGSVGVRANSISPGLTDTPMNAAAREVPGLFEAFRAGYPLGRWGTSEDIAAAAVFLASDECFMTGENLQVNGGLTLRRNPTRTEISSFVQGAT